MATRFRNASLEEALRMLSECHSNLKELYEKYPDAFEDLVEQYKLDERELGQLPTYITLRVDRQDFHTTFLYRKFLPFYAMVKQGHADTLEAEMVVKDRPRIGQVIDGVSADQIFGRPPTPTRSNGR